MFTCDDFMKSSFFDFTAKPLRKPSPTLQIFKSEEWRKLWKFEQRDDDDFSYSSLGEIDSIMKAFLQDNRNSERKSVDFSGQSEKSPLTKRKPNHRTVRKHLPPRRKPSEIRSRNASTHTARQLTGCESDYFPLKMSDNESLSSRLSEYKKLVSLNKFLPELRYVIHDMDFGSDESELDLLNMKYRRKQRRKLLKMRGRNRSREKGSSNEDKLTESSGGSAVSLRKPLVAKEDLSVREEGRFAKQKKGQEPKAHDNELPDAKNTIQIKSLHKVLYEDKVIARKLDGIVHKEILGLINFNRAVKERKKGPAGKGKN